MKNLSIIAVMLLVSINIVAANYITIGDSVRINPRYLDGYYRVTATMTVDGMLDDWSMNVTYPQGLNVKLVSGIVPLDGMTIGYTDRTGTEQVYEAPLQVSANYATISSHKKGISSHQLSRDIDVTQKTAWFILQKIRTLFTQDDSIALMGDVECDEAYIGGKEKNKHESKRTKGTQGRSTKTKTPVFGMIQRGGKVVALKCDKTDGATLLPIIDQFVAEGSNIYTDELTSYNGLDATKYTHKVVNHGRSEYVKGADFTNTIEGFWGTLKRMIEGIYHSISSKYLQRYVDEAVYRWNTRRMSGCDSFRYMFKASIGVVDYEMVKEVA